MVSSSVNPNVPRIFLRFTAFFGLGRKNGPDSISELTIHLDFSPQSFTTNQWTIYRAIQDLQTALQCSPMCLERHMSKSELPMNQIGKSFFALPLGEFPDVRGITVSAVNDKGVYLDHVVQRPLKVSRITYSSAILEFHENLNCS